MHSTAATTAACPEILSYSGHARQTRRHSLFEIRRALSNGAAIAAADALAICLALALASWIRTSLLGAAVLPVWSLWFVPAWWLAAWAAGLLPGWGLSAAEHLRRQVLLISGLMGLATALLFFTKSGGDFSRLSVVIAWAGALVLVPLGRTITRTILVRRGVYGAPAVIYGRAEAIRTVLDHMRLEGGLGYQPVGVCTSDPHSMIADLPVLGDLSHARPQAPIAMIVLRGIRPELISPLIDRALRTHATVVILPDFQDLPSVWVSPRDMSGMLGLQVRQFVLNPVALAAKQVFDFTAIALTSVLWAPLFAVIATLIWLEDRQTPFYRQIRIGRGGRRFETLKFRTMVVNAETILNDVLARDPALRAEWDHGFKLRRDPRITRVGYLLRRTSLDELPQIINVLRGEMALVGPRPLPEYHNSELPEAVQDARLRTRPGMTGLWQVSGRSDAGNSGMVRWDPYYVRNWSIWLDAIILVRTIRVVVFGSGAY